MKKKDSIIQEMQRIRKTIELLFIQRQGELSNICKRIDTNSSHNESKIHFKSIENICVYEKYRHQKISSIATGDKSNKASILLSMMQIEQMYCNIINTFSVNSLLNLIQIQNSLYTSIAQLSFKIIPNSPKCIYISFKYKMNISKLVIIVNLYPITHIVKTSPPELLSFIPQHKTLNSFNKEDNNDNGLGTGSFSSVLCKMILYYISLS